MCALGLAPLIENDVDPVDLSADDPSEQGFGDPVGQLGNARGVRRHPVLPCRGDAFLGRDRSAAAPDQVEFGSRDFVAREIQRMFAEGTGEALFCAKQYQRAFDRRSPTADAFDGAKRQGSSDGLPDRPGIGIDGSELAARLLRPRRSDTAHRIDDGAELANARYPRVDVGEPLRHTGDPVVCAKRLE